MSETKNLTRLSKHLSLILRHKPEIIGIKIEYHGAWANVKELISGINQEGKFHVTMKTLEEIVSTDEKMRYSFNETKTKIRANQGHSIDVDLGLEEKEPPEILYHGTAKRFVNSIAAKGLLHMDRQYVHLSKDEETAVKVGKRHGTPYIFRIRSGDMHREGYVFYLSDNGVWLTEHVPVRFLVFQEQ